MLLELKAGAKVHCTCDKCKKEFFFIIPLLEIENLNNFKEHVYDTMNAEEWGVSDTEWLCPSCVW